MFNLLLVILTFSSPILIAIFISRYFKYKSEFNNQLQQLRQEMDSRGSDQFQQEMQQEIQMLKERTQVLERIITDSTYDLDQKISALT